MIRVGSICWDIMGGPKTMPSGVAKCTLPCHHIPCIMPLVAFGESITSHVSLFTYLMTYDKSVMLLLSFL